MVCYFGVGSGHPDDRSSGVDRGASRASVIHRSGPNLTDRMRRVYIAQYSKEVIPAKGTSDPVGLVRAVPRRRQGRRGELSLRERCLSGPVRVSR